jgi:hypothetical protein
MSIMSPVRTACTFDSHNDLRPHEIAEMEGMGIPADALAGPVPVRSGYVVFDELGFDLSTIIVMGRRAFAPSSSSSLTARAWPVMWWPGRRLSTS